MEVLGRHDLLENRVGRLQAAPQHRLENLGGQEWEQFHPRLRGLLDVAREQCVKVPLRNASNGVDHGAKAIRGLVELRLVVLDVHGFAEGLVQLAIVQDEEPMAVDATGWRGF